ncbi:MAG: Crp/Fnr family transcriptional regulator [Firmicutes bacterium]|nr:Crp/Fnr family transcriptional regulator [Bacillota bacterium]
MDGLGLGSSPEHAGGVNIAFLLGLLGESQVFSVCLGFAGKRFLQVLQSFAVHSNHSLIIIITDTIIPDRPTLVNHFLQGVTKKVHDYNCQCGNNCASRVPIFQGLSPEELGKFNALLSTREYRNGEIIYNAGDEAANLLIVNTGRVKIFRLSADGREQIIRILHPGDFFGEAVFFHNQPLTASAQALEPTVLCQLEKTQAEQVLLGNPEISAKIIAALNERLLNAESQIENLGTRTTGQRVAGLLLDLANEQGTDTIALPLTRDGLASLTGMARENFSRRLQDLEAQGIIAAKGRKTIIIRDRDRLEAYAN